MGGLLSKGAGCSGGNQLPRNAAVDGPKFWRPKPRFRELADSVLDRLYSVVDAIKKPPAPAKTAGHSIEAVNMLQITV
jgi:hypothetical protein